MTPSLSSEPIPSRPAITTAWIIHAAAWACWLALANAFEFQAHAFIHGPHAPDPGLGFTHLMNNHGDIRYIREADAQTTRLWTMVGGVGLACSVLLLLIFVKAPTVRYTIIRQRGFIIPVLLTVAVGIYWQAVAP